MESVFSCQISFRILVYNMLVHVIENIILHILYQEPCAYFSM
jgi:hypothetical protein